MEQLTLDYQSASIQQRNLNRVAGEIAPYVLAFCKAKGDGAKFHMSELTAYVRARAGIAPDSPGRILRDLRQKKQINYRVINRAESLYELLAIQESK